MVSDLNFRKYALYKLLYTFFFFVLLFRMNINYNKYCKKIKKRLHI